MKPKSTQNIFELFGSQEQQTKHNAYIILKYFSSQGHQKNFNPYKFENNSVARTTNQIQPIEIFKNSVVRNMKPNSNHRNFKTIW
jgi:hypothetical protein